MKNGLPNYTRSREHKIEAYPLVSEYLFLIDRLFEGDKQYQVLMLYPWSSVNFSKSLS